MKDGILKETRQGEIRLVYVIVFSDIIIFTTKKEKEEGDGYRFIVDRIEQLGSIKVEDQELSGIYFHENIHYSGVYFKHYQIQMYFK